MLDGAVVHEDLHGGLVHAARDGVPVVLAVDGFGCAAREVGDVDVWVGALADAVLGGAAGVVWVLVDFVATFEFDNEVSGEMEVAHGVTKGRARASVRRRVRTVGLQKKMHPFGGAASGWVVRWGSRGC